MISEEQYEAAIEIQRAAQETIDQYFKESRERFETRMRENPIFTDEELMYSAYARCPCGEGLAYPIECMPGHYWDCSAVLKGTADKTVQHTAQLPFAFYDIKSESEHRGTTRK